MAVIISAALLCVFSAFESFAAPTAFADETKKEYSNVLDDLKKDSTFDTAHYPAKDNDYSLQVIQIAESEDKELFIYVYQPSGQTKDFSASRIKISTTINDEISFLMYRLEKLNSNGTLFKYKVNDFTVKTDPTRYYVITSIYRPFDESIDKQASGDNTVTGVPFAVNKQYTFSIINGKPFNSVIDIETIVITDKFVGFVRYENGFNLYANSCDSHFVAFNTDRKIDQLLEADVYYTTQKRTWQSVPLAGVSETFGEEQDNYAYLKYTQKVEHTGGGWFAGTYKWDRIQTVEDFTGGEEKSNIFKSLGESKSPIQFTDEAMNELKGKKWVLRFTETDYTLTGSGITGTTTAYSTIVGNVTILRLKFVTDGITYNLGVIDNMQTGGNDPSGETPEFGGGEDNNGGCNSGFSWEKILALFLLLLLVILLAPLLPTLVSLVIKILMLPFKLIGAIIKGIEKAFHKRE